MASKPSPFTISIPEATLSRLKQKLALTDLPERSVESSWKYGAPLSDIKRMKEHWETKFDWRAQEARLNQLPQFRSKITVEGFEPIDLHFVHQTSDVAGAIPLLFCHGWPGSFLEATKLLPLLKGGGNGKPAFHIVAPSLPNYGFSSGTYAPSFALGQYAECLHKLMLSLGYDQYVTQGGDWGFLITRTLAHKYPRHVKACHVNWIFAAAPTWTAEVPEPEYSEREKAALGRAQEWWAGDGRGYLAIQSTKPATVGYGLRDSPVGLLAWIYEKLVTWSDAYPWTDDEVLTWVCVYYFSTAGPDAASYIYYEATHDAAVNVPVVQSYIDVPLGLADFPVEISNAPKAWWKTLGPVVYSKSYDKGGHFAAYERPEDIADALGEMFGKGGGAYGVVEGRSGYADGAKM